MKILAVDTTTRILSAAITDGGRIISEYSIDSGKTHSQKLMPVVAELLENADINISEVDAFAAANGPGSFTGIRIGLAAARTMAQVQKKPIAPVCTLRAMSFNAAFMECRVCAVLDARHNSVYCAIYNFKTGRTELEPCIKETVELDELLSKKNGKTVFLGDVSVMNFKKSAAKLISPGDRLSKGSAASVALAAEVDGAFGDFDKCRAIYISKPQAQRELEKKEAEVDRSHEDSIGK